MFSRRHHHHHHRDGRYVATAGGAGLIVGFFSLPFLIVRGLNSASSSERRGAAAAGVAYLALLVIIGIVVFDYWSSSSSSSSSSSRTVPAAAPAPVRAPSPPRVDPAQQRLAARAEAARCIEQHDWPCVEKSLAAADQLGADTLSDRRYALRTALEEARKSFDASKRKRGDDAFELLDQAAKAAGLARAVAPDDVSVAKATKLLDSIEKRRAQLKRPAKTAPQAKSGA